MKRDKMENDCKVRKVQYSTTSQYLKNASKGFLLGNKYMKLGREALREDEMEIKMRKSKLDLESKIKK